jgi:[acyl-carrier-protein] S-malonyltransferase
MSAFAFVFPGQGSQKIGMLADIASGHDVVRLTFAEASDVLGYDIWSLTQNGTQDDINLTEKTQPILLAASVALWRLWCQLDGKAPALMAGHSLGEFSALVCAEAIGFREALELVQLRGQLMQTAVPVGVGAMAAIIGMDDAVVVDCCAEAARAEVVQAVNFNSPGQVVIAGHAEAVERAITLLKDRGCKRAMPLPVSAPFHTSLMASAGVGLAEKMAGIEFSAPKIPVVHNVHAQIESNPARIRELLQQQISSPVQWTACVQYMVSGDIRSTVECGPGKVLSGLNKRIDKSLQCHALEEEAWLRGALEQTSSA